MPTPAIDYTALGYDALRASMLAMARESLPEWTDMSENDLGVLLVELFAFACDVTLYYQTRIAANLLPATADEPDALVQLLRLIGYELRPPAPATANLAVHFAPGTPAPIVIPAGTQFTVSVPTGGQLFYETEAQIEIRDSFLVPEPSGTTRYFPVPVVEGQTHVEDPLAMSDGSPNQSYSLARRPVIAGSVMVTVEEPGPFVTRWHEVATFADSTPADRHFVVQRDAAGGATILFGDGDNGMRPPPSTVATPVPVSARYRVGGGTLGNVAAGTRFVPAAFPVMQQASNPQAAAGGTGPEDIERARSFAPRLYRTQDRAVTLDDYVQLALQVPGVGKALAVPLSWNEVVLYIAPNGEVAPPSELLKTDVLRYFESFRMATTSVRVADPASVNIYLGAVIRAQPYFLQSDVRRAVEQAVADYLDFDAVQFGQTIYLSRVYDVIQNLPQVASLTIFKFSTTPKLPASILTTPDVDPLGIIQLAPFELPRPGYRDEPTTPPRPEPPNPPDPTPRPPIYTIMEGGLVQ